MPEASTSLLSVARQERKEEKKGWEDSRHTEVRLWLRELAALNRFCWIFLLILMLLAGLPTFLPFILTRFYTNKKLQKQAIKPEFFMTS
jgi:hypothetical protein